MYLAERIRQVREAKHLSQGDIERRTGLLHCYISRVENGHTVPAIETLEKFARALELPLYQLFYDNEVGPATKPPSPTGKRDWASQGKGQRMFSKMCQSLSRMSEKDRQILLAVAKQFRNGNQTRKS